MITFNGNNMRFFKYKNKRYLKLFNTKIKIDGIWVDGIIYLALYKNTDGYLYVRTKDNFNKTFIKN